MQHIPTEYLQKITTMLASGHPPDISFLGADTALRWAAEGKILDFTPFYEEFPFAKPMEKALYKFGDGKIIGTNAFETMILFYNRELFDEAGVGYPPAQADLAWNWDQFVEVAKKLTKDKNGNDATSPDFDPDGIQTFGVTFYTNWPGYMPLIFSNGGRIASDDGTRLLLNQPEAVEVLQQMHDLIYVHHVAPTPTQASTLPATDILLKTGKVAMDMNGHWKVLDYQKTGIKWDMGVLPRFKDPVTMIFGSPPVIFSATKYPDQAFEFYTWLSDPTRIDLFKTGLWMPAQEEYYTNPDKTAQWLEAEPGVYPATARDVLIDYTLNHTPVQPPVYWLKNLDTIHAEAIDPALELLWAGTVTAQQATDEAVAKAAPLMQGRWTTV
jgi:multiple sugar transport system substrate-binding protein